MGSFSLTISSVASPTTSILAVFHFGHLPFWSPSILVVFHFDCLSFWSSSILIVFHFGRLPFWSSSILVVFHFGRLPFRSCSISVVFHFSRVPFWSSSILVVFHVGRPPFWSYLHLGRPPIHPPLQDFFITIVLVKSTHTPTLAGFFYYYCFNYDHPYSLLSRIFLSLLFWLGPPIFPT